MGTSPDAPISWELGAAKRDTELAAQRTSALFPMTASCEIQLPGKDEKFLEIDNSSLYHNYRRALSTRQFAIPENEPGDGGWPVAELTSSNRKLKAFAELKPDPMEEAPHLTQPQLLEWQNRMSQNVMNMDDLTADVLDIISWIWLKTARHSESMINVTADDFLRQRGLKPQKGGSGRRGGYKQELRQNISRHVAILSNTWITVVEMETIEETEGLKGGRRRRKKWRGEGPAIVVSGRAGQVARNNRLDVYTWRVRPGDMFAKFIFGPGRQTALLSQKALQYDPYRQKWEKRLARYFAWQWRIRREQKGSGFFTVATLLEAIKETVDYQNPSRTKQRFEKALNALAADGVISKWEYEHSDLNFHRRTGWSRSWLSAKIAVETPSGIISQYSNIKDAGAPKVARIAC